MSRTTPATSRPSAGTGDEIRFAAEVLGQLLAIARRGDAAGAHGFVARRRHRG